ncbi:hypothetical protein CRUP_011041 [Coryphaenoides rupestris]|nr:hypothetical protein CRUP_011041 [Coryphaenoides rupestris]
MKCRPVTVVCLLALGCFFSFTWIHSSERTGELRGGPVASGVHATLLLPTIFSFLPHLKEHADSLTPNVVLGQGRRGDRPGVRAQRGQQHQSQVVSPPYHYYPDFSTLQETLGDSKERFKWRTKQTLDFSFLMLYAQDKGTYYVQKDCEAQKSLIKHRHKPSLFQHIGLHSSLSGKLQNLKDKDFGKQVQNIPHSNPPAEVSTSLVHYQQHTLDRAYQGKDFFWGLTPVRGDHATIRFPQPINIKRYSSKFEDQ